MKVIPKQTDEKVALPGCQAFRVLHQSYCRLAEGVLPGQVFDWRREVLALGIGERGETRLHLVIAWPKAATA